jgi:hypothetical protein
VTPAPLRRLTAANGLLVAEACAWAVALEAALPLLPLSRLLRWLEGGTRRTAAAPVDRDRLRRVVAVVYRLLPVPATCLRQSLVLVAMLGRRGEPAALRIGVRKTGDRLAAHAWVDGDPSGSIVEDRAFTPLIAVRSAVRGL